MNASYLHGVALVLLLLVVQWKSLKKENRYTRWTVYLLLFLTLAIWVYCSSAVVIVRPMVWLEKWISPLSLVD